MDHYTCELFDHPKDPIAQADYVYTDYTGAPNISPNYPYQVVGYDLVGHPMIRDNNGHLRSARLDEPSITLGYQGRFYVKVD